MYDRNLILLLMRMQHDCSWRFNTLNFEHAFWLPAATSFAPAHTEAYQHENRNNSYQHGGTDPPDGEPIIRILVGENSSGVQVACMWEFSANETDSLLAYSHVKYGEVFSEEGAAKNKGALLPAIASH